MENSTEKNYLKYSHQDTKTPRKKNLCVFVSWWPKQKGGNMSNIIVNQLKDIIANKLDVNLAYDEIDENVSLFEDGLGLDSIAIVDLIVSIETTFSLSIEDEELNADLFKNLNRLAEFVRSKLKN